MKSYAYFKIGEVILTGRQADSLAAMMLGYTAKQLADTLDISTRTVENYRHVIKQKFHGESRKDIFIAAIRANFPLEDFIKKFAKESKKRLKTK